MSLTVVTARLIAFGKKRELTCGTSIIFFTYRYLQREVMSPQEFQVSLGSRRNREREGGGRGQKKGGMKGGPTAPLSSLTFFGTRKICPWPKRGKLTSAPFPRKKHTDIQTNERKKPCQNLTATKTILEQLAGNI